MSQRLRNRLTWGLALGCAALLPATAAQAATIKVCAKGCTYSQLAPAVAAAQNGDTVKLAKGTYAGGVTIAVSLKLAGDGASKTIISGGGPVLTIGTAFATTEPTVSIDGVTITGGVTHSSPESHFFGKEGVFAAGGGIDIPPNADFSGGATVTIAHSVITGNRVVPTDTVPAGDACGSDTPCCPPGKPCPFAAAFGGGIDNSGELTVKESTISNNTAGPGTASDADGAGIRSVGPSVTILNSQLVGNTAVAADPNGRFAEGGAVFAGFGSLTMKNSDVVGNGTSLTSSLVSPFDSTDSGCPAPCHIAMNSNGAGVHADNGVSVTMDHVRLEKNAVTASDPSGEPNAFDAAFAGGDGPVVLRHGRIRDNPVTYTTGSTAFTGPGGSAVEVDGAATIADTEITDNAATVNSPDEADITGALAVLPFNFGDNANPPTPVPPVTVTNTKVTGNVTTANGGTVANALAGGVFNNGNLEMRNDHVNANSAVAHAPSGAAQGGGIWNGVFLAGPPVTLLLRNTDVTRNTLSGSPGIALQGAGVFTTVPITVIHSRIERNVPDQCAGC